ncbi:DmsC/YnfH family molybdoenzyme membrane anchor subunit [Ferriphaselus sp. R-1]|uniref:dimethyl sulfoxide reductase anchor subunit family protein n=1 Tax=Ferriphaselus sp. R-1 TaxID=1485544 RepID=UPI000558F6C9|nr:DmsC/YnfH family molybdoenzyme membrane anchor subunit [Ferriphaselus sp. R-1]
MRPAFSVLFLTTLIGAGQGLFITLFFCELLAGATLGSGFFVGGAVLVLVFSSLGGISSVFHLGHPERAWRAMTMWRTSWLAREGIALPAFMAAVFAYGLAHWLNLGHTLAIGTVGVVLAIVLFVCTGMIYGAIKVLKEWAHPLTIVNFIVLGCASGTTLAAAYASFTGPVLAGSLAQAALSLTVLGVLTRAASLWRNATLRPVSTLQTAIGIRHPRIVQKSQGAMGGSYNTREFFHGKSPAFVRGVLLTMLLGAFVLPLLLVLSLPLLAFIVQYLGLLAERWYFFAEAQHPQNLYYQTVG